MAVFEITTDLTQLDPTDAIENGGVPIGTQGQYVAVNEVRDTVDSVILKQVDLSGDVPTFQDVIAMGLNAPDPYTSQIEYPTYMGLADGTMLGVRVAYYSDASVLSARIFVRSEYQGAEYGHQTDLTISNIIGSTGTVLFTDAGFWVLYTPTTFQQDGDLRAQRFDVAQGVITEGANVVVASQHPDPASTGARIDYQFSPSASSRMAHFSGKAAVTIRYHLSPQTNYATTAMAIADDGLVQSVPLQGLDELTAGLPEPTLGTNQSWIDAESRGGIHTLYTMAERDDGAILGIGFARRERLAQSTSGSLVRVGSNNVFLFVVDPTTGLTLGFHDPFGSGNMVQTPGVMVDGWYYTISPLDLSPALVEPYTGQIEASTWEVGPLGVFAAFQYGLLLTPIRLTTNQTHLVLSSLDGAAYYLGYRVPALPEPSSPLPPAAGRAYQGGRMFSNYGKHSPIYT